VTRSRREFVRLASTAAAAGVVWPTTGLAALDGRRPIREALGVADPELADPSDLAATALDAARAAGASFADIHIDRTVTQGLSLMDEASMGVGYSDQVGFGVRVIADGQWGFVSSNTLTTDVVTMAARRAVHQAQVNAKRRQTTLALAPAPVVPDGRWATPMKVDPFAVPVGEQQEAMLAGSKAAHAIKGVLGTQLRLAFERTDRLFASSEGSHIAQTFCLAYPGAQVVATAVGPEEQVQQDVEAFAWQAAGYEIVREAELPDAMRATAEAALQESRDRYANPRIIKARSVDVGRYELVVGPSMFYALVAGTIIPALGMQRALGKRSGEEGTSYAAPPESAVGALAVATPLLTVRGDRSWAVNGLMACGWDDEGVKPDVVTLVERGVVADYLAMREDALRLGSWYERQGAAVRAHGVAACGDWSSSPREVVPNITIEPGREALAVDDLIKDVKRGVYLSGPSFATADFGLSNGYGYAPVVQDIRDGKLAGYLTNAAIQFSVRTFWKGLVAIGGPRSVATFAVGQNGLFSCRTVRCPPARFKEVNVVNTGRTQ
jgi:TldD protein